MNLITAFPHLSADLECGTTLEGPLGTSAPRLNYDVLLYLLHYLSTPDLCSVARLCGSLVSPTRNILYRDILFSLTSPRVVPLEWTLRSHAHLRALVRHLSLMRSYNGPLYAASLEWISLLPEHSLDSVEISFYANYHLLNSVLRYPAVRTAPKVTAGSSDLTTSARVNEILDFPSLSDLSLRFGWFAPVLQRGVPSLKHLTLSMEALSDCLLDFLAAITSGCCLEGLTIDVDTTLDGAYIKALKRTLMPLLPKLRHLSITSSGRLSRRPFIDTLAVSMSSMETLCCGYGAYSPALLTHLPTTLRTLTLNWGNHGSSNDLVSEWGLLFPGTQSCYLPFPSDQYASEILKLAERGQPSLKSLILVLPNGELKGCAPIAQACSKARIEFQAIRTDITSMDILA